MENTGILKLDTLRPAFIHLDGTYPNRVDSWMNKHLYAKRPWTMHFCSIAMCGDDIYHDSMSVHFEEPIKFADMVKSLDELRIQNTKELLDNCEGIDHITNPWIAVPWGTVLDTDRLFYLMLRFGAFPNRDLMDIGKWKLKVDQYA